MTRYQTDVLSMVKDMWAKVGVELEIEPKDYGTWLSICVRRSYDDMLMGTYAGANSYIVGVNWSGSGMNNGSYIDDPVLNDTRDKIMAAFPNEAEADRIYRDMVPYLLDQAYVIQLPMHYLYRFWWPWVKNYSGEMSVGFWNEYNFVKYVWIDQQMKSSMLGK
jgi:peptide/nickel transport system substrate-binding protein